MSCRKICYIFIALFLMCFIKNAFAYDDKKTHPLITEMAAKKSLLEQYLYENLEFKNGLKTKLTIQAAFVVNNKTLTIKDWFREGAEMEDDPMCRASNHFHDPLKPWDQSYMTDEPWLITLRCFNTGFTPRYSNITWATGFEAKGGNQIDRNNQSMGWDHAREYYYTALTAYTISDRETYFAKTFKAIGHVMHLVEDVSVPAHVRNDFTSHLMHNGLLFTWFFQPYEYYMKKNESIIKTVNPIGPGFDSASLRLTDFWDTDQYNGTNVSGLAEFTNANYFSDSSIPSNNPTPEHQYASPVIGSAAYQLCEDYEPNSGQKKRWYIGRKNKPGCDHFAVVSPLNPMMYFINPIDLSNNISSLKLFLDDNVHNTYANELIPRAIGYSAALLNYFFRGEVNIIHAGVDMIKIENLSNEDMESDISSFQIFFDKVDDNRVEMPLEFYDELGNKYDKVNNPGTVFSIPANSISSFKIRIAATPVDPKNPDEYIFVFKGRIGNEGVAPYDTEYAIAAKVFKGNVNIYQINNDTFHIVNMSSQDMEGDLNSFTMSYKDAGGNQQGVALDFFDASGNPYSGTLTIPTGSKSSFTVKFHTVPQFPANPGEYMLTFKGRIGSEGTAPYDTDYAVTSQLITPHFLADAEVNGQWDIYEYDLLGNRIYNVTEALERGVVHHLAVQNPVSAEMIAVTSKLVCPNTTYPPYLDCVRVLNKSTGVVKEYEWLRIPFWSKDGQKLHNISGGHYDISTGDYITPSDWQTGEYCGFGSFSIPSLSPDGSKLVAELDNAGNPVPVDIFFFAAAVYPNGSTMTGYVDMNVMQVIPPYEPNCIDYIEDEIYFDMSPDYHPSEDIIVFDSDAEGPFNIYYADVSDLVNSRDILQLTDAPSGDFGYFNAAWSPDGQKLLLLWQKAADDGMIDVYIMTPAVGAIQIPARITTDGGLKDYPRWVPYLGQ